MDIELKDVLSSIRGTVEGFKTSQDALQRQVDHIDLSLKDRVGVGGGQVSFEAKLKENEQFQRLVHDRKGRAILTLSGKDAAELLERKTTITATAAGYQTTGVMAIDRDRAITSEARQELTVRDALTARPTALALVDFVKVNTPMAIASPQVEASDKAQNAVTFTPQSEKIKTVATWIPASRQILDDWSELAGFIEGSLTYYVNLAEELQLLSGDSTGENLNGLLTQATPFNVSLLSLSAGWNRLDIVGRAIQQITAAKEITPTFVVLHPNDWWAIRLTKDSLGRYLIGDPQTTARANLFDLTVISTTSIAAGTFLVGSGNPTAAEIRDRMELQYEISTEHSDFFVKNLVACRAEKRLALIVKRPASFVYGSFTTSPA